MIGTIRRHQNWLWGIIIAGTIFSFVYAFSPTQRYGSGQGYHDSSTPDLGSINGEPITKDQLINAEREATLFYFLRARAWPQSEDQKTQVRRIAEQVMVVDSLLKEYKITPTPDAAARFTKQIFGVPDDQSMPQDKFSDWVQNELMRQGGLNMEDLERFAQHQAGQEYLLALFGMSGRLITPKEAEFFYRRENEAMVTEIASFPASKFYNEINPTPAELQDYFSKHEAEYRLPDRVAINYVVFNPSNFMAKADQMIGTNIDEKAAEIYHQQGPDTFKDESGKALTEAEAQAKIKKQMRQIGAYQQAKIAANQFLRDLAEGHDDTHPYTQSDLEKLARTNSLAVHTTEPFDEKDGPKEMVLAPKSLHMLFSLREDAPDDPGKTGLYASMPLLGETNVYIGGLQKRFPSQLQPLSAVRDQVLKNYRESKADAMAKDAAEKFSGAAQIGLAQGKTFDAVCAAQNIKPMTPPPFALTATNPPTGMDKTSFQHLEETVFSLPTDQCSRYIPTTDGGMVAYLKNRLAVNDERMKQDIPSYLSHMREQRQIAAFQEWLNRQTQLRYVPPPGQYGGTG